MINQSHADQRFIDVMQNQSKPDHGSIDVIKSRFGRIVKLSAKAREVLIQDSSIAGKEQEVENLILHLTNLLDSWSEDKRDIEPLQVDNDLQLSQPESPYDKGPIVLLATKINLFNTNYYDQFVSTTLFDIEEPKTYI